MIRSASSNSVALDRCEMSPVWIMKDGFIGIALTLLIASSSVPSAFGLAGLSKPTWLSLIFRKDRPAGSGAVAGSNRPNRMRHSSRNGPEYAGAGPGHALQPLAAADAGLVVIVVVIVMAHRALSL